MKVVLFCGGQSLRLREYTTDIPKPMVPIGSHPILWHVMKYYAHFGHEEFILCLGHQGDVIRRAFLNYQEFLANDLVSDSEGNGLDPRGTEISDWKITFVDTGTEACVGERLVAVRRHLEGDDIFLANYADGVTDLYLPAMLENFYSSDCIASCVGVKPNYSFHVIRSDQEGLVEDITAVNQSGIWINGGYFVFRKEIFDFIERGEDLVQEPFNRLARAGKLSTYRHEGFWACMDTFKEKMALDEIHAKGEALWEVWNRYPRPKKTRTKKIVTL